MTDIQNLKRLAEAATPSSEWKFIESGSKIGFRVRSGYQAFFSLGRMHHELNEEVRANAKYVEAANPSTILALIQRIDGMQAKIDELMLEYCPDEMTPEQLAEYARHQRVVADPWAKTGKPVIAIAAQSTKEPS